MNVWYAAYGSNLSRARFDIYLNGGRPAGATHVYPGCRDATPPAEIVSTKIQAELAFGGTSRTWGGGVAFVVPNEDVALARLYLVTLEQFADVVAQENWLRPGSLAFEVPETELELDQCSTYGCLMRLPDHEGEPVLTVSQSPSTAPAAPSRAYLRHVASGLRESHSLEGTEIVTYLARKRGVTGSLTAADVAAAIDY